MRVRGIAAAVALLLVAGACSEDDAGDRSARVGIPAELRSDGSVDPTFYQDQVLEEGLGYLTTRDGTTLAALVHLPGPVEDGPYPTVVEYSAYDVTNPEGRQPASEVARALGYATVGVSLRGTGCSGGTFDVFSDLTGPDGYDAVEVIAAQGWVSGHRVGTIGLSFPGMVQFPLAAEHPPSLGSVSVMSVFDDSYRSFFWPGGIRNTGFPDVWLSDLDRDANDPPEWVREQIAGGDERCGANVAGRSETRDFRSAVDESEFTSGSRTDPDGTGVYGRLSPATFAAEVEVPVFLAGSWQDDIVGGRSAHLLSALTAAPEVHAFFTNGTHVDPLGPEILRRWAEFLALRVAGRTPDVDATALLTGARWVHPSDLDEALLDAGEARFPSDLPYEEASERYREEPVLTALLENGAGGAPGVPRSRSAVTFDAWPVDIDQARTWYLAGEGGLVEAPPAEAVVSFTTDRGRGEVMVRNENTFMGVPPYDWGPLPDGRAVAFETEPFVRDGLVAGSSSVTLEVRTDVPVVDLEVSLSEIRPDGREVYLQSGWLRLSHRALDPSSTSTRPEHTHAAEDVAPLEPGQWVDAQIQVMPVVHPVRAGSRLRLAIASPGGNRTWWQFSSQPEQATDVELRMGGETAGRLVVPVVEGIEVPSGLPPCPSLRGQPCRTYQSFANRPG